jgi:hypothetical protein
MELPFTFEEFLTVFETYNLSVFPMQVVFYLFAALAIFLSWRKRRWSDKGVAGILSIFWLWMGIVYHILLFATINTAAYIFGGLFIIQAGLFLWTGVYHNKLRFSLAHNIVGFAGMFLMIFALIIYPALSYSLRNVYPFSPTFGLPCPTTIFTFGIFLLLDEKYTRVILIIPFLWSLIGLSAALALGIEEDISLLVSALLTIGLLMLKHRKNVRQGEVKISPSKRKTTG